MQKTQTKEREIANAYDLCMAVADHIEEEPLRYDQEQWGATGMKPGLLDGFGGHRAIPVPACGTTACRAGWMVALAHGADKLRDWDIQRNAYRLLGAQLGVEGEEGKFCDDIRSLFDANALDHENPINTAWRSADTMDAYAKAGADGLRKFARKWKTRLKATPVTVRKEAVDGHR